MLIVASIVTVLVIALLLIALTVKYYRYKQQQAGLYTEIDEIQTKQKK